MILSDTNSSLCNYKAKYRQFQLLLQLLWVYILCIYILDYFFFYASSLFCQTRSLLSVFEEDAGMLTNYTNQLLQSLQRVFGAQVLECNTNNTLCVNFVWLRHKLSGRRKSNTASDECAVVGCTLIFVFCFFPVTELCVRSDILYNVNICIFWQSNLVFFVVQSSNV